MNKTAIQDAKAGHKFNTCSESQIEDIIRWTIVDISKLNGQNIADDILRATTSKLKDIIIRDYPTLTDKEFELILESGISGEFGRETWLNGGNILKWIRAYRTSKDYIDLLDEEDSKLKQNNRLTQDQINLKNEIAFESSFLKAEVYFKEKGTIFQMVGEKPNDERAFHLPQWAAQVYQHYRDKGVIPTPTKEELIIAEEKASAEMAKGNTFRLQADILKVAREDWRDSFLLENYYKSLKK